jgi:hypothetical protein
MNCSRHTFDPLFLVVRITWPRYSGYTVLIALASVGYIQETVARVV